GQDGKNAESWEFQVKPAITARGDRVKLDFEVTHQRQQAEALQLVGKAMKCKMELPDGKTMVVPAWASDAATAPVPILTSLPAVGVFFTMQAEPQYTLVLVTAKVVKE